MFHLYKIFNCSIVRASLTTILKTTNTLIHTWAHSGWQDRTMVIINAPSLRDSVIDQGHLTHLSLRHSSVLPVSPSFTASWYTALGGLKHFHTRTACTPPPPLPGGGFTFYSVWREKNPLKGEAVTSGFLSSFIKSTLGG